MMTPLETVLLVVLIFPILKGLCALIERWWEK